TALFNWGDGNSSTVATSGTNGLGTVSATHVYATTGSYTVTVTLSDTDGPTSIAQTFQVTVTRSIYLLNLTASGELNVSLSGSINIPGSIYVDSNSASALTVSGSASITAAQINVVGGVSKSGSATFHPAPTTHAAIAADPLAYLAAPTGGVNRGSVVLGDGSTVTINPGIYSQINISGSATLKMNPGVYVI